MAFTIRARLFDQPGPRIRVRLRERRFDWSLEIDRSGTFEADLSGEDVHLEIGALFSPSAQPVTTAVRAQHARGLDIDQIDARSLEAHLLHAATPKVDDRHCELVCLSTNDHRDGPGCLDCAVGDYTIRVCC